MSKRQVTLDFIFSTNRLKVLSFLAKFSDREFHEREIARKTGVSYGSANKILNELYSDGIIARRQLGKMLFYSFNNEDPLAKTFKIFVSISLVRPLIKRLRECASEIVLYGSCARGEDGSASDMDLFVASEEKERAIRIIDSYKLINGFKHIKIEPVVLSAQELLQSENTDKEFLSLVREGIVLWDEQRHEAGIQGVSRSWQDHPLSPKQKTHR